MKSFKLQILVLLLTSIGIVVFSPTRSEGSLPH